MTQDTLPDLPPAVRALLKFWRDARGPHVLPHRSAIDPITLRPWLRDISIVELRDGERRFYVRIHGAGTVENLGQDFSRKFLEDCVLGTVTPFVLRPYLASVEALLPTFSEIEADPSLGVFNSLDRLILPFTDQRQEEDDAPVSIERFLVWIGPTDLVRGEKSAVYRAEATFQSGNGQEPRPSRLTVIDIDDPRYRLDANQSTAPFAAQRPVARHP